MNNLYFNAAQKIDSNKEIYMCHALGVIGMMGTKKRLKAVQELKEHYKTSDYLFNRGYQFDRLEENSQKVRVLTLLFMDQIANEKRKKK